MDFFLKAWGLVALRRPPVGPGQLPGGGPGAQPLEAPEF